MPGQPRCRRPGPGRPWSARRSFPSSGWGWRRGCRPGRMEGVQTGRRSHPAGQKGQQQWKSSGLGWVVTVCGWCALLCCVGGPQGGVQARHGKMKEARVSTRTSFRTKPFSSFAGATGSIAATRAIPLGLRRGRPVLAARPARRWPMAAHVGRVAASMVLWMQRCKRGWRAAAVCKRAIWVPG
jgi:hypothetical protein